MERHQTHLLGIYTQANALALAKRTLLRSLALAPLEQPQEEHVTSSTKLTLSLNKLHAELQRVMAEFSHKTEDPCLQQLATTAQDLKNDRELFTQEEAVLAELQRLKSEWERQADPLIRYEQGERQAIRDRLSSQLKELQRWEGLARSTKKPLYVRKLERELRDNLERAASSERAFNAHQQERYLAGRARLLRVVGRLAGGMGRVTRQSLVSEAKNTLLRNYIDRFHQGNSLTEKELDAYRMDYGRTLQAITLIFKREIQGFSLLLDFAGKVEASGNMCYRGVLAAEDECSLQMRQVSEEIFTIVSPRDIIEVVHNCKHFFAFTREWQKIQPKLARVKLPLEQALSALKQQTARLAKEGKEGRSRGGAVQSFIQDKKFMEQLVKKETQFEETLLATWQEFLQGYLRALEATPQIVGTQGSTHGHSRSGKSRLENAFDRLFIGYLGETEGERQGSSLRHSNRGLISEFQQLIASITIFNEGVDMSGGYSCSLGPKLLIHGKVKVLPQGLYYESSFNQRNYFFGRTRLFLPKEELFQVNKQTVLLLFPDVLQVVTKYGPVYFHALGKRQTMYQHFIDAFLPQVNQQHQQQEIRFNPFKGDITHAEQRLQPFLKPLQTDIITIRVENIDFRTYFHKYLSTTEFSYQGRTYKDFKYFLCELSQGRNVHCSAFTPPIPQYLLPASPTGQSSSPVDIQQSERLITYDRKIPSVPFVSKGGDGVSHEKVIYRWGGPKMLCIDLAATLSGFAMTDSMVVKTRQVFREVNGGVEMAVSGQVQFGTSSPLNSMIRSPALSNLKDYYQLVADKFAKLERNRPAGGIGGSMKKLQHVEGPWEQERIQQLQSQVAILKKRMKLMGAGFALLYLLTLLFFLL